MLFYRHFAPLESSIEISIFQIIIYIRRLVLLRRNPAKNRLRPSTLRRSLKTLRRSPTTAALRLGMLKFSFSTPKLRFSVLRLTLT